MHQATVNDLKFEILTDENGLVVNGKPLRWDLVRIADGYFHIILDSKSYRAEVVKAESSTRTFFIKINGTIYKVALKDKFDLLLEKMGMNNSAASKVNVVKAPMPGLIIALKVKEGDTVKQGDPLLILEAMKMENIIKSAGDGVVKSLKIKQGESVEKNQVLIQFA
ncbi:MAG TPA: biotin/lipoyl-containing protein [Ohtaekwangia sp.]|nr:biotin/lipoyl-containing protein [Ohtaekwangia sp.]